MGPEEKGNTDGEDSHQFVRISSRGHLNTSNDMMYPSLCTMQRRPQPVFSETRLGLHGLGTQKAARVVGSWLQRRS